MKQLLMIALLVVASASATPAERDPGDVVKFSASVRVDVDAAGRPVHVQAPEYLPVAMRDIVETRVASWQYQPANKDGVPVAATTYVDVDACAVPIDGGYRLGVDFAGNGLRPAGARRLAPPTYPMVAFRRGTEAEFVLLLGIAADGHAEIDDIEEMEISGRAGGNTFEPELRRWAKTLRFDLEIVAGSPVPGRVRIPVRFARDGARDRVVTKEEWQARAKSSRECQLAAGARDLKPMALQPAVTVTPTPAG